MEFIKKYYKLILCCIPVISLILHWHIFNLDLIGIHVWRQTQTQNVINNFYREDMNILHPKINSNPETNRILRLEFPLMQWIFACVYKLFGPYIAVTRVLSFLVGLCSVYGMFFLANNIFKNSAIATICAWCFNFSPLFYYYTMNPMPDNMALCCGIWSIGLFYKYINTNAHKFLILSALLFALSVLIKLPFVIYGVFFLAFVFCRLYKKQSSPHQITWICTSFFLSILPAVAWYGTVIPQWQSNVVLTGIFTSGLKMSTVFLFLWGGASSVLPELIINYGSVLFFIFGFYFMMKRKIWKANYFILFFAWGLIVILYYISEINTIAFVHDYYLMPFLPPVFLVVAYGATYLLTDRKRVFTILTTLCLLILPVTAYLRADSRWDLVKPGFDPVFFHFKDELRKLTPPNAYCVVGNDESGQILLYYIDRKGWTFSNNNIDGKMLEHYIGEQGTYLFCSGTIDAQPDINKHLVEKVFDKESLRVYKIK